MIGLRTALRSIFVRPTKSVANTTPKQLKPPTMNVVRIDGARVKWSKVGIAPDSANTRTHRVITFLANERMLM